MIDLEMVKNTKKFGPNNRSLWRMFGVFGVVWGVFGEIWSGLKYSGEDC